MKMSTIEELDQTSRKVKDYLGLATRPVGIKLIKQDEADTGMSDDLPTFRGPFCRFVHDAIGGKNFFVNLNDLDCNKAEIVLGFKEPRFANIEPRVKEKVSGVLVGPVTDADVIMLVVNPAQAMTLTNLVPEIRFASRKNRTVCGEGFASVYNNHQPTLTLLCIGARTDGRFEAEELLVTLPQKIFLELPARMSTFASLSRQAIDSLRDRFPKLH